MGMLVKTMVFGSAPARPWNRLYEPGAWYGFVTPPVPLTGHGTPVAGQGWGELPKKRSCSSNTRLASDA
ncbi:MAG: hypothetical protein C0504_19335 [Candidatus Solibacter sp.]|nr:hypothetical protein [Candidatus Solibacter sp.]